MIKFRVFVQDVGSAGYSGLIDIEAKDAKAAIHKIQKRGVRRLWPTRKRSRNDAVGVENKQRIPNRQPPYLIALSHNQKDLWPNSRTGRLP